MTGEYIEAGYNPQPHFIDDNVYAEILDSVVLACVDIALTKKGQLLLGKRTRHPQPDWWIVGGRMRPGETFADSAQRLLQKELQLKLGATSLQPLTTFAAAWNQRAFPPKNNGTHTLSVVLTAEISEAQAGSMKPNDEYAEMAWVDFAAAAQNEAYHGAVRQCAQALIQSESSD